MEVFLNAFTEFNAKHDEEFSACFEIQENEKGDPLIYFYIFYRFHERLFRANSEILIFDLTYRTNRYKMPLVNIVGITSCNKSFFVGSAFLPSEKVLDYEWVFETIEEVYDVLKLSYSKTFVINGDPHIATALQRVFPGINHILCLWHINSNI
jgi:hypothetical protein